MEGKGVSAIILALLVIGMFTSTLNLTIARSDATRSVEPAKACGGSLTQPVDWWPMFRHDLSHTGYSTSAAPKTNNTIWKYYTGGDRESSPAVANGKVYVGLGYDRGVYCLDASTGAYIWSRILSGAVYSSPAVVDGRVYVGSLDDSIWYGRVYCLNASSGAQIWTYRTSGQIYSSPTVVYGKVYIGADDGNVYCLDALTGAHIWDSGILSYVRSSPAVVDGRVYIGSYYVHVYCLNASTGAHIWNYQTYGGVDSSPAVVYGRVYVGSLGGNVYCLDASTGAFIWDYNTGGAVYSSPAVVDGKVYIGSDDTNVYCLDATTGECIWSYTTGGPVDSSPAVASGKVYVGSGDGRLYCLDASTGASIWSYFLYTAPSAVHSSPAIAAGKVYIRSEAGQVYAFGPSVHDIAGTDIASSRMVVAQGDSALINVTVENQGDWTETFNVTAYANTIQIGKQTVTNLNSGANKVLSLTWNTTGVAKGVYTLRAVADTVAGETDTADNAKAADSTVTVIVSGHDVAVIGIASKTVVGQGYQSTVRVTTVDFGNYTETFIVAAYVNSTYVASQPVTLSSGNSRIITFAWNTAGFAKGNYTISAIADTVSGETDTADNAHVDGNVMVAMIGDITGPTPNIPDGKVDIRDLALMAKHYGEIGPFTVPTANCDITGPTPGIPDDKIDIRDLALAAKNYGKIDP